MRRYDPMGQQSNVTIGGPINCPVGHLVNERGERIVASWGNHQLLRYDAQTGAYLGVFASGDGLTLPNDLLLTTVPEPAAALLLLTAAVGMRSRRLV